MMVIPEKHKYVIDGKSYARVTSILNVISKPALYQWYGKHGVDGCRKIMEESQDFGSGVHNILERIGKGEDVTGYPKVYTRQVEAFKDWVRRNNVKFLETEKTIWNTNYGYAGTLDAIVEINGIKYLLDYKTSKATYTTAFLQLSAYWEASEGIDSALVLRLEKDPKVRKDLDIREMTEDQKDEQFESFLSVMEVYRWDKEVKLKQFERKEM